MPLCAQAVRMNPGPQAAPEAPAKRVGLPHTTGETKGRTSRQYSSADWIGSSQRGTVSGANLEGCAWDILGGNRGGAGSGEQCVCVSVAGGPSVVLARVGSRRFSGLLPGPLLPSAPPLQQRCATAPQPARQALPSRRCLNSCRRPGSPERKCAGPSTASVGAHQNSRNRRRTSL